jgi:beta-glucosidase
VRRKLRSLYATGVIDHPPQPRPIDHEAGEAFAHQAALQSIVLLKNAEGVLPLAKSTLKIAVIGLHADLGVLSGGGSSQVPSRAGTANANTCGTPGSGINPGPGPDHWCEIWVRSSPLQAIQGKAPAASVKYHDGSNAAAAAEVAAAADAAIVFAHQWAVEGKDVPTGLTLRDNQDRLIAAVAAANRKTIVVLQTGNPVLMPWAPQVSAILLAWYPGVKGAQAIADLLFGDANPSAKLPVTFPQREADTPVGEQRPAPGNVLYREGLLVGYRWYDAKKIEPLFAFGHGLSYSSFDYAKPAVSPDGSQISVTLTNSGSRTGAEVVQLYAELPAPAGDAPQRLIGWQKVMLDPGQTKAVLIDIDRERLTYWDVATSKWVLKPGRYGLNVGASSRDIRIRQTVTLE